MGCVPFATAAENPPARAEFATNFIAVARGMPLRISEFLMAFLTASVLSCACLDLGNLQKNGVCGPWLVKCERNFNVQANGQHVVSCNLGRSTAV